MPAEDHEDLLGYYLRELSALEAEGRAFAERYPRVAAGLGLGEAELNDPEVAHLVHSVAYLTARLQRRIDRQMAGIARDMLDVLYPVFDAPLPSMALAHLPLDAGQARSAAGARIPSGTQVAARSGDGPVCRFRTAGTATLWPVEVTDVDVVPAAELAFLDARADVLTSVRLRLRAEGALRFGTVRPDPLRLWLGGLRPRATRLLDLLLGHLQGVVARPAEAADGRLATLPPTALRPFGLDDDEALLPLPAAADPACRLLLEYFAYPAKHLLLELAGLASTDVLDGASEVELHFLLDRPADSATDLGGIDVRTNAVPLINLFAQISEPVRIDGTRTAYRLEPDRLRARSTEIWRVEEVFKGPQGDPGDRAVEPLYGFRAAHLDAVPEAFWQARRVPTRLADADGSDVELAFLDRELEPDLPGVDVAYAGTLCTNRGVAAQLPIGHRLDLELELPLATARLLTTPTPQAPPLAARGAAWQLVSQLSLNHLALDGAAGLDALREILRLYAGPAGTSAVRQIEAMTSLVAREAVRRIGRDAWRGFVAGTAVDLEVDRDGFVGASPVLFGAVLDRFLGRWAAANSFSELRLRVRGEADAVYDWPARCGRVPLL
ncbi:MAG: type VI secretion system baseplate subunit TssF [Alphaproteobacteria bacterium]